MRYAEVAAGFRIPISAEEQDLLTLAKNGVKADDLDERQQELASQMVSRGVMRRTHKDKSVVYRPDSAMDIWRPRT